MKIVNEFYAGLKTEIKFWRELMDQSDLSPSSPEYLRMHQALQLARRKLSDHELTLLSSVVDLPEH